MILFGRVLAPRPYRYHRRPRRRQDSHSQEVQEHIGRGRNNVGHGGRKLVGGVGGGGMVGRVRRTLSFIARRPGRKTCVMALKLGAGPVNLALRNPFPHLEKPTPSAFMFMGATGTQSAEHGFSVARPGSFLCARPSALRPSGFVRRCREAPAVLRPASRVVSAM